MYDLSNLLKINGKDAWTSYHVFLGERNRESRNINSLMRVPAIKPLTTVDFHERNGVELPENTGLSFKAIDRPLQFWIVESSLQALMVQYNAFMREVTSGNIILDITGWRECRLVYKEMSSQPEIYEDPGRVAAAIFTIKFLEPNPSV